MPGQLLNVPLVKLNWDGCLLLRRRSLNPGHFGALGVLKLQMSRIKILMCCLLIAISLAGLVNLEANF